MFVCAARALHFAKLKMNYMFMYIHIYIVYRLANEVSNSANALVNCTSIHTHTMDMCL